MKRRTLAVAGSIAALSVAAAPVAAVASSTHQGAKTEARTDRSRDLSGTRHVDRSPDRVTGADRSSPDNSRDVFDR